MENQSLHDRLVGIQSELKAPKGQYNSFGKYKYRSAEDILEAVKPLLKKYDCELIITDEIVLIGDRYYVKASATLSHGPGELRVVSAYAREADTKAGMDCSQITGAASSYARKYAMNGLFAIDDTKDADALNTTPEYTKPAPKKKAKPVIAKGNELWQKAIDYCKAHRLSAEALKDLYSISEEDIRSINDLLTA